ncbi:MAG: ATP-binding protein, partial [Alphaproteobacteria bacterium]|nr:ATP-binding protein [Alphaproteobacteria bacterium]
MAASSEQTLELDLPATIDGLGTGLGALERRCAERGLPDAATARILTVFEEIFTNTVKYGYRDGAAGHVRVTLDGPPVRLVLEDDAAPFDPTAWDSTPDMIGTVAERPVGRLGIALVMGLARAVRWQAR